VADSFSGTLFTEVIQGDSSNPLGGLTFVYRLTNNGIGNGGASIGRLTTQNWSGYQVDTSYNAADGVAPATIDRSPLGDVVGFNFFPSPIDPLTGFLLPGGASTRLVVQTDAPAYVGILNVVINDGFVSVASLGPAGTPPPVTVPEGGSAFALLGLSMSGLGVSLRLIKAKRR
jgi:hypothetical protein